MVRMHGLTVSITSFKREVGMVSRLEDEDFILDMVLLSSDRVIGANWCSGGGVVGEMEVSAAVDEI